MRLRVGVDMGIQTVELAEHRAVSGIGLLSHQTADRLVGYAHLATHRLDAVIDARKLGTHLIEQDAGLAGRYGVWAMSRRAASICCRPSSVMITWNASSKRLPLSDSLKDLRYSSWYEVRMSSTLMSPACMRRRSASPLSRSVNTSSRRSMGTPRSVL